MEHVKAFFGWMAIGTIHVIMGISGAVDDLWYKWHFRKRPEHKGGVRPLKPRKK